jgi:hypothetical protein
MNDTGLSFGQIRARLAAHTNDPVAIIDSLTPMSRIEVLKWARCLPLDPGSADTNGPQVVGIARTIAKRAMREHGLWLTEDGRMIGAHKPSRPDPKRDFMRPFAGEEIDLGFQRDDYLRGSVQ